MSVKTHPRFFQDEPHAIYVAL